MKKILSLIVLVVISMLFLSSNTYAQNNLDSPLKNKLRFLNFLNLNGDGQYGFDEIRTRERTKTKLKDGSGECIGFVDEDGDGVCDNCDGGGDCDGTHDRDRTRDRDRLKDGSGKN